MLAVFCAIHMATLSLFALFARKWSLSRKRMGDAVWFLKRIFNLENLYQDWCRERPEMDGSFYDI